MNVAWRAEAHDSTRSGTTVRARQPARPARRLLVEAAWHHRPRYKVTSPTLRARWALASPAARERGHQGNVRLHRRWQSFEARGKRRVVENAAVARELAGWCWSLAVGDGVMIRPA